MGVALAGLLIGGDFPYVYCLAPRLRTQGKSCSAKGRPTACDTPALLSGIARSISVAIYSIGFFTAYALGPILARIG